MEANILQMPLYHTDNFNTSDKYVKAFLFMPIKTSEACERTAVWIYIEADSGTSGLLPQELGDLFQVVPDGALLGAGWARLTRKSCR
jgi:hypothetical protein